MPDQAPEPNPNDATNYVLSHGYNEQIKRVVRQMLSEERGEELQWAHFGGRRVRRYYAVLCEDLDAASDAMTAPKKACCQILKRNHISEELELVQHWRQVVNRFQFISVPAQTLVKIEFLNGEWSLYSADCGVTGIECFFDRTHLGVASGESGCDQFD